MEIYELLGSHGLGGFMGKAGRHTRLSRSTSPEEVNQVIECGLVESGEVKGSNPCANV